MKRILFFGFVCLGIMHSINGQDLNLTVEIVGENNVLLNSSHQYHTEFKNSNGVVVNPPIDAIVYWGVGGGTKTSETDVFCDIIWTQGGEGHIYFEYMNATQSSTHNFYYSDDLAVQMPEHPLPKPDPIIVTTYECGSTQILRTNGPPVNANYDWWWQKDINGTSTAYGNGTSITIQNTEGLELRARLKTSPFTWSESYNLGTHTVQNTTPGNPEALNNLGVFRGEPVTIGVVPSSSSSVKYSWYNSEGSLIPGVSGASYTINNLQTTSIFQVQAYNGPCINTNKTSITAAVEDIPIIYTDGDPVVVMDQPKILYLNKLYDTYLWKNSYGDILGAEPTLAVNSEGSYSVTVTKSGFGGEGISYPYSIWKGFFGVDKNFVISNRIKSPEITDLTQLVDAPIESVTQQIEYIDGLGRIEQVVIKEQSPGKRDLVLPHVYDEMGREYRKYLPFTSDEQNGHFKEITFNNTGDYSHDFYRNPTDNIVDDQRPFSQTIYEPRPDNRVLAEYGPGEKWGPAPTGMNKYIAYRYATNSFGDASNDEKVMALEINDAGKLVTKTEEPGFIELGGYYSSNQLHIKSVVNEHGLMERQYTDKSDRLVLTKIQKVSGEPEIGNDLHWASTYNIYDGFGKLRLVIPPEGVRELKPLMSSPVLVEESITDVLNKFVFQYKYDARKRLTHKKTPGADWMYLVYDDIDRLVLTQDGEQRKKNKWTFTKYDAMNRPVLTGIYIHGSLVSQQYMQVNVVNNYYSNMNANGDWFESFTEDNYSIHGYNNKSFPVIVDPGSCLTVTYYDNYRFLSLWGPGFGYVQNDLSTVTTGDNISYTQKEPVSDVIGLVTGTKIRTIDAEIDNNFKFFKSINYYDDKYLSIQQIVDNDLGGKDRITSIYDFVGNVLKTKTTHQTGGIKWKETMWTQCSPNSIGSTITGLGSNPKSIQSLAAQTNGSIEFRVEQMDTQAAYISLSSEDGVEKFTFLIGSGTVQIHENGQYVTSYSGFWPSDVFKIERIGTRIVYSVRGKGLPFNYESLKSSSAALFINATLDGNSTITSIKASFANGMTSQYIERLFTYDHADRLLTIHQSINSGIQVQLVKNEYNELGQLADKTLHYFKQSIDYRYHIRGWLTSINNSELSPDVNNEDNGITDRDYFGMDLAYENPIVGLTNSADVQYNGNVSAITYSKDFGSGAVISNGYKFQYDAMNRLKSSNYRQKKMTGWNLSEFLDGNGDLQHSEAFSETGLEYDLNGNIRNLTRSGLSGIPLWDVLNYNYEGNRLLKVDDDGDSDNGFIDGNLVGNDYAYDSNGNMTSDANKGITGIIYNNLNLPDKVVKITGEYLKYTYDGTGTKISQQLFSAAGELIKKSTYAGVFFYENDTVKLINHSEGRVVVLDLKRQDNRDLIYRNDGSTLDGIIGDAATPEIEVIGGKSYIKVTNTCPDQCYGAGVKLNTLSTNAEEVYYLRVKAYSLSGPIRPQIMLRGNGTTHYLSSNNWLPNEAESEDWIELTYKIPFGIYDMDVYLTWWDPSYGQVIYINDIELYKLKDVNPFEYQYFLKDHLGNTRIAFTTKDEFVETNATLEPEYEHTERSQYVKYDDMRRVYDYLFDHTKGDKFSIPSNTPGYSLRLNGSANERNGLARSISVMPGDKIDMQVFGKYIDPNLFHTDTVAWNSLISFVLSVWAPTSNLRIDGLGYNSASIRLPAYEGLLSDPNENSAFPKAHLNWAIFDRNDVFIDGGARQLQGGAENGTDVPFGEINGSFYVNEPGYVYIWLSNTSPQVMDVYFDDFKVQHTKSPIVQQNEYYPFGLSFNSFLREDKSPQLFLYQDKEWQQDLELNLYDFEWRQYDPLIARTTTMDPKAESYQILSPYSWAANNPLIIVDPDGQDIKYTGFSTLLTGQDAQTYLQELNMLWATSDKEGSEPGFYSFNTKTQARREDIARKAKEEKEKEDNDFFGGFGDGVYAGGLSTVNFVKSLSTLEGWKNMAEGIGTMGQLASAGPNEAKMQMAISTALYTYNIPNMTPYEIGYDGGYVTEKVAETILLSKGAGATARFLNFGTNSGFGVAINLRRFGKLELMYRNPTVRGGTLFSYQSLSGRKFRLDFHSFNNRGRTLHFHTNYWGYTGTPHRSLNPFRFGNPIK